MRSSSPSPSVGVSVITGRPIGVLLIDGFFACGVALVFGSVCFSIWHVGVVLRICGFGVWVPGGSSGTTKGDLVFRCLCVGVDFGVGGFSGCLDGFGLLSGAFQCRLFSCSL